MRHQALCTLAFGCLTWMPFLRALRAFGALLMRFVCLIYALYLCVFGYDRIS